MHFHFLDTYAHLDSPVHRLPSPLKLGVAVAVIITAVLIPPSHVLLLAPLAFFVLLLAAASQVPGVFLAKRLIFLEPFVVGVAVLALFQPNGRAVFLFILARSTLCLFTMILLANTTPFNDTLAVLRRMRVPALIVTTLALMHRYLYVLLEESSRMRRARAGRTFTPRRAFEWRTLATVASQLFVRSGRRAERIYAAMCSRGWR